MWDFYLIRSCLGALYIHVKFISYLLLLVFRCSFITLEMYRRHFFKIYWSLLKDVDLLVVLHAYL